MNFLMSQNAQNKHFSFQLVNDEDTVLLNSPEYPNRADCVGAIQQVIQLLPSSDRYETKSAAFSLKNSTGLAVAQSIAFSSDEAATAAIQQLAQQAADQKNYEVVVSTMRTHSFFLQFEAAVGSSRIEDDYQDCSIYIGPEGYSTFEKDNYFYFSFNKRGKVILRSERYPNEIVRDNGLESVKANSPLPKRYKKGQLPDGTHYFAIMASNGQEVARSCYKQTEEDTAIDLAELAEEVLPEGTNIDEVLTEIYPDWPDYSEAWEYLKEDIDNYFPCDFYIGDPGFYKFLDPETGRFFFSFMSKDGRVLLRSERYIYEESRDNAIESVTKNAALKRRYRRKQRLNGRHYFVLLAGNGQEIARSCYTADEKTFARNWAEFLLNFMPPGTDIDALMLEFVPNWNDYKE